MNYIIFGAGQTGRNALHFLGYYRVAFFAANIPSGSVEGKNVISYERMMEYEKTDKYIIVVASAKYNAEMVAQLKADGVKRYFVFHDGAVGEIFDFYPGYSIYRQYVYESYSKALSILQISKYKKIAIYGGNFFLPYLISEISFQNDIKNIVGVVTSDNNIMVNLLGVPHINFKDVWGKVDCVIVNERRDKIPHEDALIIENKERDTNILYLYNLDLYIKEFNHPELIKYKNIHEGKRCFLIGNGPSMRVEDLETLHRHREICFGFNKIYRIYDKTKWRANYLGISDPIMMENCQNELPKIKGEIIATDQYNQVTDIRFPFAQYIHVIPELYGMNHPGFSNDICKGVFAGFTVVYELGIQLAAYMGFKEIYLIGVDCSISGSITDKRNHFIDNYFYESEKKSWDIRDNMKCDIAKQMKIAFEKAAIYCLENGISIYNATRGGELEAFERVDFDEIFQSHK